jgi:hypothetical protein
VLDDVVLQGRVQQMVAVEIEAAPVERSLRGGLKRPAGRVAEELRHVDPLDLTLGRRRPLCGRAVEEVRRRTRRRGSHGRRMGSASALGEVDLTQVLDFLGAVWAEPDPRRDRRSSVALANGLVDSHQTPLFR